MNAQLAALKETAARAFGVSTIDGDYRGAAQVWGRAFVVHFLRGKGLTWQAIAQMIGRHHADAIHLHRKVDDALTLPGYGDIRRIYNDFINKASYETDKGTTGSARTLRATL